MINLIPDEPLYTIAVTYDPAHMAALPVRRIVAGCITELLDTYDPVRDHVTMEFTATGAPVDVADGAVAIVIHLIPNR